MKKEATLLLKDLVSLPSFEGDGNPLFEKPVNDFLLNLFLKEFSLLKKTKVNFAPGRYNILFQNSSKVKILFACHTDTVSPSDSLALKLRVTGDRAYGLGTKDMKGGIVSLILAFKKLDLSKFPGVGVLFYGDEETGFLGIKKVVQESGQLFVNKPEIIVSPESRFNLGIGARGITTYEFEIFGVRAHSARSHLGKDAIRGFFILVSNVEKTLNRKKSPLGETTLNIANIRGGLVQPDGSIGAHAGSVPDYCKACVSVRNATSFDGGEIFALFEKESKKMGLKLKASVLEDFPSRTTPKSKVKRLCSAISRASREVEVADPKLSGFNDMAILARALGTHAINFGPYGEGNHTKDEWVSIDSILKTSDVFVELIKEYAK